jgi:hypothetical protein
LYAAQLQVLCRGTALMMDATTHYNLYHELAETYYYWLMCF